MTREKRFQLRQSGILLITALIWGVAFVAQSVGMEYIGPFTVIAVRFFLGGMTLVPVTLYMGRGCAVGPDGYKLTSDGRAMGGKTLLVGGILCGAALWAAATLQQIGIGQTTVGKAGFLTAMYIVIVPILGIILGRRPKAVIWLCVAIACAGIYFLSMPSGEISLTRGDALCLSCAFLFAVQIMIIDHFVTLVDGVRMAMIQFFTASVLGTVMMLIFEHPSVEGILRSAGPLLYLGVMSSGVAYTLQIVGQRGLNPTIASLIMSLESTISVIAGFFLLHQALTPRELAGCILMGAAIVLAQIA